MNTPAKKEIIEAYQNANSYGKQLLTSLYGEIDGATTTLRTLHSPGSKTCCVLYSDKYLSVNANGEIKIDIAPNDVPTREFDLLKTTFNELDYGDIFMFESQYKHLNGTAFCAKYAGGVYSIMIKSFSKELSINEITLFHDEINVYKLV